MKTIVIDCGHGMNSKGMFKRPLIRLGLKGIQILSGRKPHTEDLKPRTYREDFGTLKIGKALKAALECMGYRVYLTREDEREVKLFQEEKFIKEKGGIGAWRKLWSNETWTKWFTKQKKADLFISIHTNAGRGTGPTCFYYSKESKELAEKLCQKISEGFGMDNRGAKKKGFSILKGINKAVLFEVMFHDSPIDLGYLVKDREINRMAQMIAQGVYEYDSRIENTILTNRQG